MTIVSERQKERRYCEGEKEKGSYRRNMRKKKEGERKWKSEKKKERQREYEKEDHLKES